MYRSCNDSLLIILVEKKHAAYSSTVMGIINFTFWKVSVFILFYSVLLKVLLRTEGSWMHVKDEEKKFLLKNSNIKSIWRKCNSRDGRNSRCFLFLLHGWYLIDKKNLCFHETGWMRFVFLSMWPLLFFFSSPCNKINNKTGVCKNDYTFLFAAHRK